MSSPGQRIASGIAWVALFVVLGKLAGAAKEVTVAMKFGVGVEVDAYALSFALATWPAALAFSVLCALVVPAESRLSATDATAVPRLRAELLGLTLAMGAAAALVFFAFHERALPWLGLAPASVAIAAAMTMPLTLVCGIAVVTALYSTLLMSSGRHLNTLLEAVPSVVLCVVLAIAAADELVTALAWGTLAGAALHLLLCATLVARAAGPVRPRISLGPQSRAVLSHGAGVLLLGQILLSTTPVIEQVLAAGLGTGAPSTLSYANRVVSLFLGLGALVISRATLPVFSDEAAREPVAARHLAWQWTLRMGLVGVVAAILLWIVAPWLVSWLFERGRFTASDSADVSSALRAGALQLPTYLPSLVLSTYAAATQRLRWLALSGLVGFIVRVPAAWIGGALAGVAGLAAAPTLAHAAALAVLCWPLWRDRSRP